eukprot:257034-Prymnesium_polylepis.1
MLSLFKEFVESVMYKQLATVDASADYESALELATVCHEDSNHAAWLSLSSPVAAPPQPRTPCAIGGEARAGAPEPGPWRQG